jgi:hypothetical protein
MRSMLYILVLGLVACAAEVPSGDDQNTLDDGGDGMTDGGDATDDTITDDGDDGDDDDSGVCESEVVPAPTAAGCAAATQTCLEACEDEACVDTCFAADPDPDGCGECLESAYVSCVNAAGCQEAYDALECCVDMCTDPESDECYTTTCATESTAYDTCTTAREDSCDDSVCYAP